MQNPLRPDVVDVPLSGDPRIDGIALDLAFAPDADGITRLTFSIPTETSTFPGGFDVDGVDFSDSFTPVFPSAADFLRQGAADVSAFANIEFTEVADTGNTFGVIRLLGSNQTSSDFDAFAFFPFGNERAGNILLTLPSLANDPPTSIQRLTLHEFGHALGLDHPGDRPTALPADVNGEEFTILNPGFRSAFFPEATAVDLRPSTFGYVDILALQHIYGANTEATAGDATYSFDLSERHYLTIYDIGGTDSINITGAGRDVDIDLTPGSFINVGTVVRYFQGGVEIGARENTVYLTPETVIENVSAAGGDDRLVGNDANNRLLAGAGNDTIDGGIGDDFLRGDAGNDHVSGGVGDDTVFAGASDEGDDTLEGNAGDDLLGGGAGNDLVAGGGAGSSDGGSDTLFGGSGDDTLLGGNWNDLNGNGRFDSGEQSLTTSGANTAFAGTGDDLVYGAASADILGGGAGNDTLAGGAGNDVFFGGQGTTDNDDVFTAGAGADTVFGGIGNDNLQGQAGDDALFGGSGVDTLDGGAGADSLFGGTGDDVITGGDGADAFFFGGGHGADVVTDFDVAEDRLFLANAITDFNDLASVQDAASEVTQNGQAGLLIDTGGGNSIFLVGVSLNDLSAENLSL